MQTHDPAIAIVPADARAATWRLVETIAVFLSSRGPAPADVAPATSPHGIALWGRDFAAVHSAGSPVTVNRCRRRDPGRAPV